MSLPLKELISIGANQLREAGVADAEIDAKELYCYMKHIDRVKLMLTWQDILQDNQCEAYFDLIEKRAARTPLQHITGSQEFMGLKFIVNENVLIPRQDTETLVEDAIEIIEKGTLRGEAFCSGRKSGCEVLDLCTGSGAIGISIAKLCHNAKVTCSDISKTALEIARKNASENKCNVKLIESDLFSGLKKRFGVKKFDMIISNPPYIESDVIQTLEPEVREHEPMTALDGGSDGLDFYRKIVSEASEYLKKKGVLIMEIGHNQRESVKTLLEDTEKFENITCLKDLAGRDRIVAAVLRKKP